MGRKRLALMLAGLLAATSLQPPISAVSAAKFGDGVETVAEIADADRFSAGTETSAKENAVPEESAESAQPESEDNFEQDAETQGAETQGAEADALEDTDTVDDKDYFSKTTDGGIVLKLQLYDSEGNMASVNKLGTPLERKPPVLLMRETVYPVQFWGKKGVGLKNNPNNLE